MMSVFSGSFVLAIASGRLAWCFHSLPADEYAPVALGVLYGLG